MSAWHVVAVIAVVGAVTFLTRAAPFWFFKRGTPRWVNYLGRVLPPTIMAILVVYCLRGVSLLTYPYGLPELLAGAAVVGLHLWKKNNLISILGGTALYMVLVQLVFAG